MSNVLEMKGMFEGCRTFRQYLNWEFHPDIKKDDMFKNTDCDDESRLYISPKKQRVVGNIIKYSVLAIYGIVLFRLLFRSKI